MFNFPEEARYSKDHVWLKKMEGAQVRLGLTEIFQEIIGEPEDLEFLLGEGGSFEAGEPLIRIYSADDEMEVACPLSGRLVSFNLRLADELETLIDDPHEEGWLAVIELDKPARLKELYSVDDYEDYVEEELSELDEDEEDDEDLELSLDDDED